MNTHDEQPTEPLPPSDPECKLIEAARRDAEPGTGGAAAARPPSAMYEFRKLVSRHKVPSAFLAVLFALVVGFGVWMSVLYAEADRLRIAADAEREAAGQATALATARLEEVTQSEAGVEIVSDSQAEALVEQPITTDYLANLLNQYDSITERAPCDGHEYFKVAVAGGRSYAIMGRSAEISGDWAVLGAYNDRPRGLANAGGAAYVFRYNITHPVWEPHSQFLAPDGIAADWFGVGVAISGDVILVGACRQDDAGTDAGKAYVFRYNSSTDVWNFEDSFTGSDTAAGDHFAQLVDLSADGTVALIGAPRADVGTDADAGAAYVFRHNAGNWTEEAKLTTEYDGDAGDRFGNSVAIGGNDVAVVGAVGDDARGDAAGAAYIFRFQTPNTWPREARLTASDAAAGDVFGRCVAVDGDLLVVGAPGVDVNAEAKAGAAYVFHHNSGNWTEEAKLWAEDAQADDRFGMGIRIEATTGGSGGVILVGSPYDDDAGEKSGSVYAFFNDGWGSGSGGSLWPQAAKFTASDAAADDHFGFCVDIDGGRAIVGALRDDAPAVNSGSGYLLHGLEDVQPTPNGYLDLCDHTIVGTEAFVHDEDGNLISDAVFDYAYDAENRLISWQARCVDGKDHPAP